MEPTLILDASGAAALVAVYVDGKLISRTCVGNTGQAGKLTAAIPEVLEESGIRTSDLKTIVCGRGPGSFTGIRIALATAQGLISGLGESCKFIGVDAFSVQKEACRRLHNDVITRNMLILIDSKRPDLFGLECNFAKCEENKPFLINISNVGNFAERLSGQPANDTALTGDALDRPDAPEWIGNHNVLPINIEAIDLLSATVNCIEIGSKDITSPLYLRKPDIG